MAADTSPTPATAPSSHTFQTHNKTRQEVSRREIQAAIAKAVELRALHAALVHGNSPAPNLGFTTSPVSRRPSATQLSAQDYPVFAPSYKDEAAAPCYQQIPRSGTESDNWEGYDLGGRGSGNDVILPDYMNSDQSPSHICPSDDQKSVAGSCNKCRPATITAGSDNASRISKSSNVVVPLTDSHASVHSPSKTKRMTLPSWFTKLKNKKEKKKHESSTSRAESEEVSSQDLGNLSIESLKKELMEANENRDAALLEVMEMKSSLGDLRNKLEYLESYCEELKKATQAKDCELEPEKGMPVSEEVMVEAFLQIVSESRLSVKQFCKTLIGQIEEADMDNINSVLQPYKLSLNSKHSKAVLYHLEAVINQSLYQDFENSAFQKNGSPKFLDPQQDRQAQFASFVALRNLSWNEVLRKGTKYYSEEFSRFCDQKMSCIIATLNWTRPWTEQLLQSFFIAAKCIWLLHQLAFSFNPTLGIMRVEESRSFDAHYMEDMFMDRQRLGTSRVKVMVMPGFYVQDRVLRCKVVCKYKSVA